MAAPLPTLRPYQAEAGRAIVDSALNRRGLTFTIVMARQAGKNELSAQVELFLLLRNARQAVGGVKAAPTFQPQCKLSMNRLWSRIVQSGLDPMAEREDSHVVRIGRARVLFLSAEATANVVGHTAGLLLEIDEAQDVDREKFDGEFQPMAASTGATTVYYGTPWDDSTLLEQAVQRSLELQRRDGIRRHFAADWQEVASHNQTYGRYVEAERERLGENHPLFLTQYALKPVPGAGRLFSAAQRAQLMGTHARRHTPADRETYVAGLDIGGGASESGVPHDELFARLADLLGRVWAVRRVVVDATGLGETLARLLERTLGSDIVRPLKITSESKSRLGYDLIAAVNSGRLRVYAGDGSIEYEEFWRQVEAARIAYRPSQQMNFYVDASEGHDDYLVSLALTAQAASDPLPRPRVARGRAPVPALN